MNNREFTPKQKEIVRRKLQSKILSGKIKRPDTCQMCGEKCKYIGTKFFNKSIQAHHADYGNPENILWVCFVCHKKIHFGEERKNWIGDLLNSMYDNLDKNIDLNLKKEYSDLIDKAINETSHYKKVITNI